MPIFLTARVSLKLNTAIKEKITKMTTTVSAKTAATTTTATTTTTTATTKRIRKKFYANCLKKRNYIERTNLCG